MSPASAFVLGFRRPKKYFDNDEEEESELSDISSLEEEEANSSLSFSSHHRNNISLHATLSLDSNFGADMTISEPGSSAPASLIRMNSSSSVTKTTKTTTTATANRSMDLAKGDNGSDQEMQEPVTVPKPTSRVSKKQELEEIKERERLLRLGGTNLKPTVNRKLTLQDLMAETEAKQ